MDTIRIGRVSSVDAAAGTVSVTYTDRSGATTAQMPYFAFNDEYKMPVKEQMVLVLHLANGSAAGIVLGGFWNAANLPAETGEGLFLKQLGSVAGQAYIRAQNGAVDIYGSSSVALNGTTIADILSRLASCESRLDALEAEG